MMLGIINKVSAQIAMPDTVCVGTSRVYKVNDAIVLSTYTWKIDGVTQSSTKNDISITWNTAGTFLLSVQEHVLNGCDGDIRSGLVYVNPLPVPNAGPDVSICFGDVVRLNGSGGAVYQWSPPNYLSNTNTANPLVTLPLAGTYRYILSVSNKGCQSIAKDTVIITMRPPVKVFAGNDTLVTISQPLQLNAVDVNNSSFINYIWSPPLGLSNTQIKNPVAILNNNITYTVTAKTIDGCTAKDDIVIKVFAAPEIYVPNAFTPNNDGQNDVLRPILTGIRQLKYFAVYNRYGQEIYRTSVHGQGWNGLVKGVMQNTGAFVWIAEAVDYKGNILKREGMAVLVK
jgi:gliding motility-associated-like protein